MHNVETYRKVLTLLKLLRVRDLTPGEWSDVSALSSGDPFLSDTVDGLRRLEHPHRVKHLNALLHRLQQRYPQRGPRILNFMTLTAAAAVALVLIGVFWFLPDIGKHQAIAAADPEFGQDTSPEIEDLVFDQKSVVTEHEATDDAYTNDPRTIAAVPLADKEDRTLSAPKIPVPKDAGSLSGQERKSALERQEPVGAVSARGPSFSDDDAKGSIPPAKEEHIHADEERAGLDVHGLILDPAGDPLPGVLVESAGNYSRSLSDRAGNFSIRMPETDVPYPIKVTHAGYGALETEVAPEAQVVLQFEERAQAGKTRTYRIVDQTLASPGQRAMSIPLISERNYLKYLRTNIQYPEAAENAGVHGTVEVEFDVDSTGTPVNLKVIESLGYGCDEEAIRLVREGPKWRYAGVQVPIGRQAITF